MDYPSFAFLLSGLIDCITQLLAITEELLRLMAEQQIPTEQNDKEENMETEPSPSPEESSLPDLANLSDLETILESRNDEDLLFDIDEIMLGLDEVYDDTLAAANDQLRSD
ncbi:putative uncharacterized protein TRPC5OS [Nycticebus coucang]|uniref:putative uncharacterized protein TRPC5OS n=1 Tax=Nycticebus coucang TaxID=9470 RepID=UPI00234DA3B4|nr:putative uncharacterized protein TRPC5OS [Nycticebus coucang]